MSSDKLAGLDDQQEVSNYCAGCRIPVGPHNDSGWRVFVDGGTRPICGVCEFTYGPQEGDRVLPPDTGRVS